MSLVRKKVLCDLLCDRTSVCCSRSCSLCTAFMTSSPEAGSWSAGFGVEESCQPWEVLLHTSHQLEELPRVTGAIGKQWSAACGQRGLVLLVWARRKVGTDGTGVWLGRSLESKCLRRSGLRNSRIQVSSHVRKEQGGSDHARRTESVRGLVQRA